MLTQERFEHSRALLKGNLLAKFDGLRARVRHLALTEFISDVQSCEHYIQRVDQISLDDVRQAAENYFTANNLVVCLSGNAKRKANLEERLTDWITAEMFVK